MRARLVLIPCFAACCLASCGPRAAPPKGAAAEADASLSSLAGNQPATLAAPPDPLQPATASDKSALAAQAAINLEKLLNDGTLTADGRVHPQPPPTTTPAGPSPDGPETFKPAEENAFANVSLEELAKASAALARQTPEPAAPEQAPQAPASTPPTADPLAELASKMASLLRQKDAAGKALLTDAAALTPIDAMKPGVLATLDQEGNTLRLTLDPADAATLVTSRDRVLANPAGVDAGLVRSLRGSGSEQIRIPLAALCARVDGFGRFSAFTYNRFVAGQPIRAIVYVEVDGFAARAARSGDPTMPGVPLGQQVSVDLTQSLSVYHDGDGMLAWHSPAQSVIDTGRSKRRDFYLIQQIELPRTFSVGRYNLKVIVKDRSTDAEAEHVLPIEIVADPTLVRAGN